MNLHSFTHHLKIASRSKINRKCLRSVQKIKNWLLTSEELFYSFNFNDGLEIAAFSGQLISRESKASKELGTSLEVIAVNKALNSDAKRQRKEQTWPYSY